MLHLIVLQGGAALLVVLKAKSQAEVFLYVPACLPLSYQIECVQI